MDKLPVALRPGLKRLEQLCHCREELVAVVFIVRLIDGLHMGLYATFLSRLLLKQLCRVLRVDLDVDFDVFSTRWSWRQGTLAWKNDIAWDYDGAAINILSKIATGVLQKDITPLQGLQLISEFEQNKGFTKFEMLYRELPTRILVIPVMAATCAAVFFEGTWVDMGFATLTGLVAGGIHWFCTKIVKDLSIIQDMLLAIATSMIASASMVWLPGRVCFQAQVIGTLYWFLVGTGFVLSIYEITNKQIAVGTMRFVFCYFTSVILSFGVVLGLWMAVYAGEDRYDKVDDDCTKLSDQISDLWFILLFPLCGLACLLQFRIRPHQWLGCLVVQCVAYGLQYGLQQHWGQPDYIANFIPAYAATLASKLVVMIASRFRRWKRSRRKPMTGDIASGIPGADSVADLESTSNGGHHRHDDDEEHTSGDGLRFDSREESDQVQGGGNRQYASMAYVEHHSPDIWFALIPALYLLVPGAQLLRTAFGDAFQVKGEKEDLFRVTGIASSVLLIGLAQALGVRSGLVTLRLMKKCWMRASSSKPQCSCASSRASSTNTE